MNLPARLSTWIPMAAAMACGAALAGVLAWHVHVRGLDRQITTTRAGLKKLTLSGGIPPNQEVREYLAAREATLTRAYQHWVETLTALPAEAAVTDPQLYFQEQLHDVQRMLERTAAARGKPVPEQLGFPKELPPSDAVPRLLAQLSLIQELAGLVLEQGVISLSSFRIEDPEPVPWSEEGGAFLSRLPVRVRLTSSLPQLMKILAALNHVRPLIDVRAIRIVSGASADQLDVELTLARYLITAVQESPAKESEAAVSPAKPRVSNRR